MKKLLKKDIIQSLADKYEGKYSVAELTDIITTFLANVADVFKKNGRITLAHFGTFFNRERKPRQMKLPSNGQIITTKHSYLPSFRPSVSLKRDVNPSK